MPPNRSAQTSTEVKKAYKKNGPVISERTHKQLERGYELEQRAAREREFENRRKAAKVKREERERKERAVRQQLGVGLATQMIGYSHTQANLKKGMETFLGVNKKRQDDERRKMGEAKKIEDELAKKLEVVAQETEKDPFDDFEDMDDVTLDLPTPSGGNWLDDELDDDTLLEIHDLMMSDPVEEPRKETISILHRPATAPPTPQAAVKGSHLSSVSPLGTAASIPKAQSLAIENSADFKQSKPDTTSMELEYTRTHGPINKVVETALNKMPGEIIELLSRDATTPASGWTPVQALLHKLNPIGLPPHRLRIKVGCVVMCLRDLNTSSQLSKSQHVQVLRIENDRLDCLTLDGQLAGTKTVITRVPFSARYRNEDNYPFTRIQYPVRVASDYAMPNMAQESVLSGFKLPSVIGKKRPPALVNLPTPPTSKGKLQVSPNPSFKLPGRPTSKAQSASLPKVSRPTATATPTVLVFDGWDDFLESGTQIAREITAAPAPKFQTSKITPKPFPVVESIPPLSTQDLDFSLEDLDDEPKLPLVPAQAEITTEALKPVAATKVIKSPPSVRPGPLSRTANIRRIDPESDRVPPPLNRPQKIVLLKSKRQMGPPPKPTIASKKPCLSLLRLAPPRTSTSPTTTTTTSTTFHDFGMSTQDATSFFDDDDEFTFGSPPIAA